MTALLRPRNAFPTPLFRATVGCLVGGLGGIPGWLLIPRWDADTAVYLAVLAVAAALVAAFVALRGRSGWRLAASASYGAVAMLAIFGVEVLLLVMTARYE